MNDDEGCAMIRSGVHKKGCLLMDLRTYALMLNKNSGPTLQVRRTAPRSRPRGDD